MLGKRVVQEPQASTGAADHAGLDEPGAQQVTPIGREVVKTVGPAEYFFRHIEKRSLPSGVRGGQFLQQVRAMIIEPNEQVAAIRRGAQLLQSLGAFAGVGAD